MKFENLIQFLVNESQSNLKIIKTLILKSNKSQEGFWKLLGLNQEEILKIFS